MADLITHGLIAWMLPSRGGAWRYWVISGAVLPDLLGRAPVELLAVLVGPGAVAGPLGVVALAADVAHLPVGFLLLTAAVAMGLPASLLRGLSRPAVARALLLGAASHLAVDILQRHTEPMYALLWPLSDRRWELGWVGTEDSLLAIPVLAALAGLVRWRRTHPPPRRW